MLLRDRRVHGHTDVMTEELVVSHYELSKLIDLVDIRHTLSVESREIAKEILDVANAEQREVEKEILDAANKLASDVEIPERCVGDELTDAEGQE